MAFLGPIYRPPSEAESLLIQATAGCPHNKCAFCLVYKKGPAYQVRPLADILADLDEAAAGPGAWATALFLPAGNTIAMPAADLAQVCAHARLVLPRLRRITVYGSSPYLDQKTDEELRALQRSGLTRVHVGWESGSAEVLRRVKKGADPETHLRASRRALAAGLELSLYVVLGLGGAELTQEHAQATAELLNRLGRVHFVRLRTLVPKVHTLLLHQWRRGRFQMLGPHGVLAEARALLERLEVQAELASDHYTNYLDLAGRLPQDRPRLLAQVEAALARPESSFRPLFVGAE